MEKSQGKAELAYVEYRDSRTGRQPYLKGPGLAVWEVIMIGRGYDFDAERMSEKYHLPLEAITAAFQYYERCRAEIDHVIEDNDIGYEAVKRRIPGLRLVSMPKEEVSNE